jgi:hypothetical protein
MTSTQTYFSINRFVDRFLEIFPNNTDQNINSIHVLFNTRDVKISKFDQQNIKVIGIVYGKQEITFKTLTEKIGPNITISIAKKLKINTSKSTQILEIDVDEYSFTAKDGTNVTYHKHSINDGKNKIFNSLQESYNNYLHTEKIDLETGIE